MEMMGLVSIFFAAMLTDNFILSRFLGICPFLGVSKKLDTAIGMSWAVIFVMTIATLVTWSIQTYLLSPNHLDYLETLVFVLVIATIVQFLAIFFEKYMEGLYRRLGIYLPLISTNCAVVGVTILNSENNYNLIQSVVNSIGAGLGFMLAMVLFAGVRGRIELSDVPKSFQGFPITLIAAAFLAIAFLGFQGLI